MNVLVVDDSADIRFMLRVILEDAGMQVEEAASGEEALERLADPVGVDAVVLDQRMPVLTGLEVAQQLVAAGGHPPMILFSAYLHPVLRAEAEELGLTTVVKTELSELVAVLQDLHGVPA
jgi:CheY-like chemotaxis protein